MQQGCQLLKSLQPYCSKVYKSVPNCPPVLFVLERNRLLQATISVNGIPAQLYLYMILINCFLTTNIKHPEKSGKSGQIGRQPGLYRKRPAYCNKYY
jgi:hypothetical protein